MRFAVWPLAALLAWTAGLVWFAGVVARNGGPAEAVADRRTEAIVVLTGGSERLATGVDLLARGKADRLFVSGVHPDVRIGELLAAAGLSGGVEEGRIVLGHVASDTVGNAEETAAWMRGAGLRSLRLVTANYHMPRSLLEFRIALPEAEIVPHPVAPGSVRVAEWWRWPGTAGLIVGEYNKYLVTLLRYHAREIAAP